VGLTVNPFKGGFVTENRPWPILEGTSAGFPPEPTLNLHDDKAYVFPTLPS
jgi:hypothetical protein